MARLFLLDFLPGMHLSAFEGNPIVRGIRREAAPGQAIGFAPIGDAHDGEA